MKYLFCLFIVSTVHAIPLWPFPSQSTSFQTKIRNNPHQLNLVYEFGAAQDRVWIKSKNPHWNGIELFRGRLKSIALRQKILKKTLSKLNSEVQSRIEFFPTTQTQALFADDERTYLLDLDNNGELVFLELNKIYERPVDIELTKSYGSGHPRHFLVTIREHHISPEKASLYYEPLAQRLREENQYEVFQAIQGLVMNQNNRILSDEDKRNLVVIDNYLLEKARLDPATQILPLHSKARFVGEALEMRLLAFGAEPFDTWLFQYSSQQKGLIFSNQGLIVNRFYSFDNHLTETVDRKLVILKMSYPDLGFSAGDAFSLQVPVEPESFHQRILEQKRKGLQGHSGDYKFMLDEVCSKFLL